MEYSNKIGVITILFIAIIASSFSKSINYSKQDLENLQQLYADSYHTHQIADCVEESSASQKLKQLSKGIRANITAKKEAIDITALNQNQSLLSHSRNTATAASTTSCPTIRVKELQGIPNFSETDQLVICGKPDTLAYLIFIEEAGNISGTQLTLDFKQGMQYAGFQLTHYDGTAISVVDPTPEKPRFLLDGITDGVYVAYVGVESTCEANIDAINYTVDLKFNFIYEDTLGNFSSCKQVATPDRVYNTTIRKPVLNFRTTNNINITSLGTQFCTTINLSQDGIKANLSEFNFAIANLDLTGNLALNSLKANAIDLPFTYDAANKTLQASPNGQHFNNNSNPSPADDLFDTNEQIAIQLCFQVDECPDFSNQLLTYLASYGCNGDTCEVEQANVTLTVAPTTRPTPIVTSSLDQLPSVCGNPGIINLTVTSNQQDSAIGLFQDLVIGYETCEKPSLDISKVIIGIAPNTTEITPENFSWEGKDLKIDFTNIDSDPDGDGIGITDADGDGFYDDLPGGQMMHIAIELDFTCSMPTNPTSLNCSNLDCSFSTFYVKAKRDCGQSFTAYPTVTDFQITNGATFVGTNQEEISNGLFGINFGSTGTSGAKTKKVEFSYIYNRENVTPCSNEFASNKLQVIYNGTPAIVQDVVLKPNSIKVNGQAVADSKATWTNVDNDTRILVIDAGLNLLNELVTYEYELTVDTILCSPPIYMEGSHQVIETCNTGDCECQTVLACEKVLFRSDPNASGCDCVMRSRVVQMYRESTGFTDATMSTKVQPEDVLVEDRNRYLPGDTMVYEAGYRINSSDAFTDIYEWGMGFRFLDAGFISGRSTPNLELMMDAGKSELRTFEIKKAGTTERVTIDFSDIPACLDDDISSTTVHGISMYYGTSPWDETIYSRFQRYSGNSGYDYYDNARIYIQIRNQTKLQECRNVDYNSWADNGNCWDDFNAKYQFQVGDSLFLKVGIPLTKNPHRVLAQQQNETPGTPLVYQDTWVTKLDEFDSDCLVGQSICRENVPFQTYCPSEVVAKTTLQIDDCGGTATHTFGVSNTTPINWYSTEYRPYFQLQNMDLPILSPMMYCGNAKGITKTGIEFPLTLQDTSNHTCVVVNGQSYCSVSSGNEGTITFNPQIDGFPGLGVGLGGYRDSFKVTYDLCLVCPVEIAGLNDYQFVYDYQYRGDPPNGFSYRCNFNANDPTTAEIEACADLGTLFYYYNEWMLDTLTIKNDNVSTDKIIEDQRLGFPALTQTLDRNLFSSMVPGSSEEINTITIRADGGDLQKPTHKGVMATIKLANSVALKNVYDEDDAVRPFTYVTTDGTTSTYRTTLPDLAPGDSVTIKLGTTLLFCPFAPLPPPNICVNVTSGCMDPAVQAAVVGQTEACNANEVCYAYVFGAAAIQADFLKPAGGSEYPLCSDIPVAVLIKNVKNVTVTDLTAAFDLPITGAKIVEGSFQASYPNGGDFTKPFYDIDDPEVNGNQLIYSEDQIFSPYIHSNGFPGITTMLDSNQMVIQFLMRTVCDSFVSGSRLNFKATAADPCSVNLLSSGTLNSDQTIIENANPKDFAQILTIAEPAVAYCGATDTEFTLTGQNISQKPSGDLMQICLTFPKELVYRDNSIGYAIPAGQSVGNVTKMEVNGLTQICFSGVNNLPLGGQFTLKFKAEMQEAAACGMVDIGVQIKELVKDQICSTGGICDVFVQTSVNDAASLELKAPIETVDLQLNRTCSGTNDPVTICYEAKLYNPGLDYTGDITLDIHDDLLSNKVLDDYDPILATKLFDNQFIAAGDTLILSGCFELEELNACPVFANIRYETDCVCDFDTKYFDAIGPDFIAELPQTTVLCAGAELGIATCGEYTYTIDSPADAYMRTVGDSLYFGLNNPANEVSITVQGNTGECAYQEVLFLKGLVPFTPYLKDTEACVNTPAYLQLVIPAEYEDEVVVSWSPTTNIDDPTILDPIFTAASAGTYTYTVELAFGDGCIISEAVSVNVQATTALNITSEVGYCIANPPRKLTTDSGFDRYEWYIIAGGFEIIQAVTTTNFWAGPSKGGNYIVKGYKNGILCPSVSPTELVPSVKCPSLGNLVWEDTNNDGLSANETGIPNVEVKLYKLGTDRQKGGDDDLLVDTKTTDENGFYLFTNLDTGSYYVVLTNGIPNGMTSANGTGINGVNPAIYEPASDPDNNINNDDNGTQNQQLISSEPITINLEAEPINDGDDDNSTNLTLDFGLIRTASLGDFVWEDINGDGIQNDGETGIQNIQVILNGTDRSGQIFRDTTYTDAMGAYNFNHLLPGEYEVTFANKSGFEFTQSNEGSGSQQDSLDSDANAIGETQTVTLSIGEHNPTLDAGFYQPASIGNYVWLDTNADGIQNDGDNQGIQNVQVVLIGTDGLGNAVADTTLTNEAGFYEFTDLVPGDYAVKFVNPTDFNFSTPNLGTGISQDSLDSDVDPETGLTQTVTLVSGEHNPTLDAGLFEYASIGDFAWLDINANGSQDTGDTGIANIKVVLTGKDNLGNEVIKSTTTLANGSYLFDNLVPGQYSLAFGTPNELNITFANINPNDSLDSDIDTKGMTSVEILESGEHNPTYDAGYFAYASIGDYVWEDINANGVQEEEEPAIANIVIVLKGIDAQGKEVELSTKTNEDGFYSFDKLVPGEYAVTFETPANFEITLATQGENDSLDSNIDLMGLSDKEILISGEHNPTYDAGYYQLASIGDYVWLDTNADGIQNDGENQGIQNVQVILIGTDGQGNAVADTTLTNEAGFYEFTNLVPGDYAVKFINPTNYNFSTPNLGTGTNQDSLDSDVDPLTGLTQTVTLVSGENNPTLDAGLFEYASIGDFAWIDINANGSQDTGDTGIANIKVVLTGTDNIGNEVSKSTTTLADGSYLFDNLIPGQYSLAFEKPEGLNTTFANINPNDSLDSDINALGITSIEILESGEHNPTYDAGYFAHASLGDYVWLDTNADGIQNDGENQGIQNVQVILIGTDGQGNAVADTTLTNEEGFYEFTNLVPGDFAVKFVNPTDYNFSTPNLGTGANQDSLDSDVDPETGLTQTVTLVSGENNPTLDAGLFEYASIGDFAWIDINANGSQDTGDTGIANIKVVLTGTDNIGNEVSKSTTTLADGSYLFDNLVPGQYSLAFEKPDGLNTTFANINPNDSLDSDIDALGMTTVEILESGEHNPTYDAGFFADASIGDYVWEDLNANGIQDSGEPVLAKVKVTLKGIDAQGKEVALSTETNDEGYYSFEGLVPGEYALTFTTPTNFEITLATQGTNDSLDSNIDLMGISTKEILISGEHNPTYDAGYYQLASIGNYVWEDLNVDGIQNEINTGIKDVIVRLTGTTGFGEDITLETQTNENGFYLFENLIPGSYQVSVIPPTDYFITAITKGENDSLDSNIDEDGLMMVEILTSGEQNLTYDAGLYQLASIGDFAWIDVNGDGMQNEEDTGIKEVKVSLTGTTAFGETINLDTLTNEDGRYLFDDLIPGTYKLTFETPELSVVTFQNIGLNDSLDSDINNMGMTAVEVLESGEHNPTYDAGYFMGSMLGNYVWEDLNANGIQEENEPIIAGVTVTLNGLNDLGHKIALMTGTDEEGFYLFPNLIPGKYTVTFTTPEGFIITQPLQGSNDSLDSNINLLGVSEMEILISGEYNPTYDAGYYQYASIGNYIWEDTNADGIQNEGDTTGLQNVVVYLTGTTATGADINLNTTTNENGFYLFDNLIPGTYQVNIIQPTGFEISEAYQTTNDSLDSNIDKNGFMQTETLISGEHNPTYDAGIYQLASIGNYVWEDVNGNGIQDEQNTGIQGVTVSLTGTNAKGESITLSTTTDENGFYLFDDLIPGTYQVSIISPEGYLITPTQQGTNDSLDSNIDENGLMMVEILTSGEHNLTYDAGLYKPASIGNYVWVDVNVDGLQNEGDTTQLANVPVFLKGINGIGDSIKLSSITDENGAYLFDTLAPGIYQISFDIPAQYKATLQQIGNDTLIDSNPDSLGISALEILTSGEHNPSYDLGLIPDFDLALKIQLAEGENRDVTKKDTVCFDILVYNQGTADAFDIQLKNYIPKGLIFDANLNQTYHFQGSTWQADSSLTVNQLLVGESISIPLKLMVDTTLMDSLVINHAEIAFASRVKGDGKYVLDIDSHADSNRDNDIIGGNNLLFNEHEDEDDQDFSYVIFLMEVDPIGYIYCDKTGHILTGGTISIQGPPRGVAYIAQDGLNGMYQWWTNGVAGVYTMSYNHPSAFPLSDKCLPQPGVYDPTGRDGQAEDMDGITGNMSISLGTNDVKDGTLVDSSCTNNPYYLSFHLASGDPIINNNHVPIKCAFISSSVCEDQNNNGQRDVGEVGLPGITVNLYKCTDTINPIATTLTGIDGVYEFDGLAEGDYMVQFVTPQTHRFALDANPIGLLEQRGGFSECTTLTFGECDTTISMCLVPCPKVAITPGIKTVFFGETVTAKATGGNKYRWTPNIEIDCDTCETVKITPSTSRVYTVAIEDGYGCNNPATLAVNVLYNAARIYGPCECTANNNFNSSGSFSEQIAILSTTPNETWKLVKNNGIMTGNSFAATGTTLRPSGKENGFYKYTLDIIHEDGIGYSGDFSNGTDILSVGNICFSENSCRVIIPPTDSTSTPPPPIPVCTNIINVSNVAAIDTLADCNGCEFRSEGAEDATLYRDTSVRNNVHTICPSNQWQTLKITFSQFDIADGDTLYVYDGADTLNNLIGKYSGTGVSQTGGWLTASCQPSINASGCLTFNFKTNGDNKKGTGWIAETTCLEEATTLTAPNNLGAKLACEERYKVFEINPATVTTNCAVNQDSQLVRIYNSHGELCRDTLIAFDKNFKDTFAIGQYVVEYKLKTDTVKSTQVTFTVQAPSLVCNDKVSIPLGSACSIQVTPDDLLENPCDTITDTLYYHITLKGLDKDGQEVILATGGGKGGHYPILDKTQFNSCGNTIKAVIERRYYENTNLTICNNGLKTISCETNLEIIDNAAPIFITNTTIDTFTKCEIELNEAALSVTPPIAIDNCDSVVVTFNGAKFLSPNQICDTTSVEVEWLATDLCGNQATQTQLLVFVRPSLADIIKTTEVTLSCDGNNGQDFVTAIPQIKIGQLKNGVLIPSDTIPLSTQAYVCGYILQNEGVFLPSTACGKKVFRYWSILDWCNSDNGPQPIDTTFIHFKDTTPPKFVVNAALTKEITLDPFACSYDVQQINAPMATDNCSEAIVRLNAINSIQNGQFELIPANDWATLKGDSFQLEWIAADACQEQMMNDTLYQILLLKDVTKPSVSCINKINLSIPQTETRLHYRDIDAGSFDACGLQQIAVSRNEINWDSIVVFTCEDIHQENKVYLRVTDQAGNQNTCWAIVNVEDKIAPICEELPDTTGICSEIHVEELGQSTDTDNDGQMDELEWVDLTKDQIKFYNTNYGNPNCTDNVVCGGIVIQQQYQLLEKSCGQINVSRRYRAVDWQEKGNISNWVEQTITIEYQPDWAITLPADWSGVCNDEIPASIVQIENGACDALAYEVTEKTFSPTGAGGEDACLKTIRTFSIINWCVYQAGTPAVTIPRIENEHGMVTASQTLKAADFLGNQALANIGRIEYHQVLKIQDQTAPIITVQSVNDCITSDNCQNEKTFSCSAIDCNEQSTAALTYEWTLYKNKVEVDAGIGNTFNRMVTVNEQFEITWAATDACGNTAQKTQFYYFVDCQKPQPYCVHGLAIDLMENGQVEVWAKDFDVASQDNCTSKDDLIYRIWHPSYEAAAPTHIALIHALPERILFDCDYLGNQKVRLYLIDEANNWDFCETYINVQDNQQVCESTEITQSDTTFVNGQVLSWKGETVEAVTIEVAATQQITDLTGQFEFQLPKQEHYQIIPSKDDQPLNGVSTFDLVLISKHILGLSAFTNPHQYIAADANKSGTVTAFDMVQLRRLILAIDQQLPNNTSWRFVAKDYVFPVGNPLQKEFPESMEIMELQANQQVDFTAIKIGDVNGNAATNSLFLAESRTNSPVFEINVADQAVKAGQSYEIAFTSDQMANIEGYQFSLDFGQLAFEKLQPALATIPNFGLQAIKRGWLTTSWNGTTASAEQATTTLFTMRFTAQKDGLLSEQLQLQASPTVAEAYNVDGELMDIELKFHSAPANPFELYQNQPNPFDKRTVIGFYLPTTSIVNLTLLDERGALLKEIKMVKAAGYQSISLEDNDLPKGLIIYQLQTDFGTQTKKMLRIE